MSGYEFDLRAVREEIADALSSIYGMRYSSVVPNSTPNVPIAYVGIPTVSYHQAMGRGSLTKVVLPIQVVLCKLDDKRAQMIADSFISIGTPNSVIDALEDNIKGEGIIKTLQVLETEPAWMGNANEPYLMIEFTVEVYA